MKKKKKKPLTTGFEPYQIPEYIFTEIRLAQILDRRCAGCIWF